MQSIRTIRRFFATLIIAAILFVICPTISKSQLPLEEKNDVTINTSHQETTPAPEAKPSEKVSWLSSRETVLSMFVLLFGITTISQQSLIIKKSQFSADDIVKIFGLSFIIIATLFIITAGYDSVQIAPAMGLFGTVAGYILGKNEKSNKE